MADWVDRRVAVYKLYVIDSSRNDDSNDDGDDGDAADDEWGCPLLSPTSVTVE